MPSLVVYGLKDDPSDWLLVFAFAPEATAIFGFLFFLLFDRPYLQSEQFQIRKMEIEMIEEKGRPSIEASQVDELTIKSAVLPALSGQVEDE